MIAQEVIIKKRNKNELTRDEISFFIEGVLSGNISEKQTVAFLASCFINGLSPAEITYLTQIMTDRGFKFDFSSVKKPIFDKHSTGGIGDKVSLILLPVLLDLGIAVPMISGRGLGHTGGTLDKLESIIGLTTSFTEEEAYKLFENNSGFIISQTKNIAPADKIFYSLRDECGLVDSIGLIVSSILSKKLAEDIQGLVMDIKVGNGAFMQNLDMAKDLGSKFKDYANFANFPLTIIYSDMNQPLGKKAGNWNEIEETIDFLSGRNIDNRLKIVTYENIIQVLKLTDKNKSYKEFSNMIDYSISSGRALNKFKKVIESQGGDLEKSYSFYENTSKYTYKAKSSGYLEYDTTSIGYANYQLCYKNNQNGKIDYSAGFEFLKEAGDFINEGDDLIIISSFNSEKFENISNLLDNSISFNDNIIEKINPLIEID